MTPGAFCARCLETERVPPFGTHIDFVAHLFAMTVYRGTALCEKHYREELEESRRES